MTFVFPDPAPATKPADLRYSAQPLGGDLIEMGATLQRLITDIIWQVFS